MNNDFYRAFEDRYRGSRDLIKSRLQFYSPFITPLLQIYPFSAAVDLGCGRGEWLELLRDWGFNPVGVDLDEGMLDGCHHLNLPAQKCDALTFLKSLPNDSQAVVSAFHVVEHVSFEQLQTLVTEAIRVLKPGGILIMETPNPENIIVATRNFYLDPSHQRPIPPQLLSFVTEYQGFLRNKVVRLQESKELVKNENPSFNEVLSGASPDYAVIAQKNAEPEMLKLFEAQFELNFGLSLEVLAVSFSDSIDSRFKRLEATVAKAESLLINMQNSLLWRLASLFGKANRLMKLLIYRLKK